jgi:GntR family transcriptional regulator
MREPLYYKTYKALKDKIEQGVYNVGDLLPTEIELENIFKVSRITIRKAVEMLSNDGYIVARQGKGTEVLNHKTTQKLNYVTSFAETLLREGYHVSSKNLSVDFLKPPNDVLADLKINSDNRVVRIYRIRMCNGKPIAIMINYLIADSVIGIEEKINEYDSLYSLLNKEYNIYFDSAVEKIGARLASPTEADILQVKEGTALLTSRRVSSFKGTPMEVVISTIVADKYEYNVYLKGLPE